MGLTPAEERADLARDIWKAGVTDPDLLAEYLIREGWGKREVAFGAGVVSTVAAVNAMPQPMIRPLMRGKTL